MRVVVTHTIGDLTSDLASKPGEAERKSRSVVRKNVRAGNTLARKFARASAGPHGENYYKRIAAEMTGPLSGVFGPEGIPKTEFVGAGYRNGPPNRDLANAADIIGPKLAEDVRSLLGELFW